MTNPSHPTIPKSISVIRIEYAKHNIGIVEGISIYNPELLNQLIMEPSHSNNLISMIQGGKPPEHWTNDFGVVWRHYQALNQRHPQNTPWFFGHDAGHLPHLLATPLIDTIISNPNQDIVIAMYYCPENTWFRNEDGQVAFIKSQATRHPGIIDRDNILSFKITDPTSLHAPTPPKKPPWLPAFLEPKKHRSARAYYAQHKIDQHHQQLRRIAHFWRASNITTAPAPGVYTPLPDYYRQQHNHRYYLHE